MYMTKPLSSSGQNGANGQLVSETHFQATNNLSQDLEKNPKKAHYLIHMEIEGKQVMNFFS